MNEWTLIDFRQDTPRSFIVSRKLCPVPIDRLPTIGDALLIHSLQYR